MPGSETRQGSTTRRTVVRVEVRGGEVERRSRRDALAGEEPLEIRLVPGGGAPFPLSVTMRTPGADFELAAGFLYGEGVVERREEIASIRYCVDRIRDGGQRYNLVNVHLAGGAAPDPERLRRNFYASSGCGVCGKASIDAVRVGACPAPGPGPVVEPALLLELPRRLRAAQAVFERTGGLHAAALFDADGTLRRVREDVGRHNALDKLIGASLLAGELPLRDAVVLVSGRLSFELVQKAARAGVPVLAAVSAPSSLAVELAAEAGMTLVGFLRGESFNVYCGGGRIAAPAAHRAGEAE